MCLSFKYAKPSTPQRKSLLDQAWSEGGCPVWSHVAHTQTLLGSYGCSVQEVPKMTVTHRVVTTLSIGDGPPAVNR